MDDPHIQFRKFLLQISRELERGEFEQLKFVLKASPKCKEMTEAFQYFEELQKLELLTPTRLELLKEALHEVGRADLVTKLEEKEQFFADLFSSQVADDDNLEQTGL